MRARLAVFGLVAACAVAPPNAPTVLAQPDALLPGPCRTTDAAGVEIDYRYDEHGRLIERRAGGVFTRTSYDAQGRREVDEIVGSHRVWYVYDGGVLVAIETDRSGRRDVVRREERLYDEGRLVQRRTLGPHETVLATVKLIYAANALARVEHYDAGGSLTRAVEVDTDALGRVIGRRHAATREHYAFSRGRLTERTVWKRGALHSRRAYRYDAAGNLLAERETDGAGSLIASVEHDYSCWPGVSGS